MSFYKKIKMIKLMEISGIESAFLPNDFWLTEAYPCLFLSSFGGLPFLLFLSFFSFLGSSLLHLHQAESPSPVLHLHQLTVSSSFFCLGRAWSREAAARTVGQKQTGVIGAAFFRQALQLFRRLYIAWNLNLIVMPSFLHFLIISWFFC